MFAATLARAMALRLEAASPCLKPGPTLAIVRRVTELRTAASMLKQSK